MYVLYPTLSPARPLLELTETLMDMLLEDELPDMYHLALYAPSLHWLGRLSLMVFVSPSTVAVML